VREERGMDADRQPTLNPYLRRPWTRGRIGGRTRRGALMLLAAVAVYLLLLSDSGWIRQAQLERKKRRLMAEIEAMQRHQDYLSGEAHRLETDPAYKEQVAREHYGFMEQGETIYHLRYVD